jgi:hypothetical protein
MQNTINVNFHLRINLLSTRKNMPDLLTIFISAFVAMIVATVTAIFAHTRYRLEKLWDRKFQSYIEIIEAMHYIKMLLTLEMNAEIEKREIDDDRRRELNERWKAADLTLRKTADIASLLISQEAEKYLRDFIDNLTNSEKGKDTYFELIDEQYDVIDKALNKIVKLATLDVKRRV